MIKCFFMLINDIQKKSSAEIKLVTHFPIQKQRLNAISAAHKGVFPFQTRILSRFVLVQIRTGYCAERG